MNKKKIFIFILMIIIAIFLIIYFFNKCTYKTLKSGNTISKSTEGCVDYILNMNSYEAEVELTVNSNKNTNKYILKQAYSNPNIYKQEVVKPSNIEGLTIKYDGTNLKIENTQLDLQKIYEDYEYISDNSLCLHNFINNYKESEQSNYNEEDNQIVMQTTIKNSSNKYVAYQKLWLEKNTGKPIKMELQDINQNTLVYILYNEIKINSITQEEILAFKIDSSNYEI